MIKKTIPHFSLDQICRSGQCFRMSRLSSCHEDSNSCTEPALKQSQADGRFLVLAGSRRIEISQQGEDCIFYCENEEFEDFWKDYFHLDGDYGAYIRQILPEDSYLSQAARHGFGIRILHQDLWETIVSFLISQQNNITRIRRCIENICRHYGETMYTDFGISYQAFPRPEALAGLDEDSLMACNLGYRSKYVVRAARNIAEGTTDLSRLRRLPCQEARQELLKLYGVGEKVADCICLFALRHFEAFPVDTHIRQALQGHYPDGFPSCYHKIQGVLQQYIFYYELHSPGKGGSLK